ncbi:DUF4160 domain-containing protein [Deinococcus sp. AJ005]|uniref:DUF4160 domain-containing protein n=1 Tax=Deinococcus sp. AJ005 TaxID=2652443 RepID=UPI00125CC90D|nr:DUF4160 domain-containing protein [Deinococcus sp. AJ005]QFP77147.1 DUF4160 domain-containing protein [Deinococcus sp. AJ005]
MPEVCSFYGIKIVFYYRDHLPPHFHAIYGDDEATVLIDDLALDDGWLPRRALRLVLEWAAMHQVWELARAQEPLGRIDPLE